MEMKKCLLCGCEFFKNQFGLHLKNIHNMSKQEYYDIFFKKDDGKCVICKKETKFISLEKGYKQFCSRTCIYEWEKIHFDELSEERKNNILMKGLKISNAKKNKTEEEKEKIKQKVKQTKLERYGDENYINLELMRKTKLERYGNANFNNIEKNKQTKLERYGNANFNNIPQRKKTCFEKYGFEHTLQLKTIRESIRKTKLEKYGDENYNGDINKRKEKNIQKYGVDNYAKTEEFKEKIREQKRDIKIFHFKKIEEEQKLKLISFNNFHDCDFLCLNCNNEFNISNQMIYLKNKKDRKLCPNCYPYVGEKFSKDEKNILNFISDNFNGIILSNNTNILGKMELDIYLPDIKLAFEFNGIYWHNELYVPLYYHRHKTDLCEKQGIHLIHIYEDDWCFKQDIVKSRILNLLGKSNKIYARNCQIKEISFKDTKQFLIDNHIQGFCVSKINLGLYYEDELVSLMTFGKLRKNLGYKNSNDNQFELLRFCNKLNTTVVGGANKLFSYFINTNKVNKVISYADRSWTMNNGNTLYDKLGFKLDKITQPNYSYVINNRKENRFNFRKNILVKQGFDENKSEHQIMLERNIFRIYDSGQLKFVWDKEEK